MNKVTVTIRYWFSVILRTAIRGAKPLSTLSDWLKNIILSLVAAFILVAIYGSLDPLLEIGVNFKTIITLIIGLIVPFLLRVISGLVYLPAKIYEDQGGFIENPFDITPDHEDTGEKFASLILQNKSPLADIENCVVQLLAIFDMDNNRAIDFTAQRLTWSGREQHNEQTGNQSITVSHGDERRCDVAYTEQNGATAKYATGHGYTAISSGRYRLTIQAHGKWKGITINYSYVIELNFVPKSVLRIENVSERSV
jgi:hypothetical protein